MDGGTATIFGALIGAVSVIGLAVWKWWLGYQKRKSWEAAIRRTLYREEDIQQATRYYVRPYCSNVDSAQEAEERAAAPVREYLFQAVERFLEPEIPYRYLLVLADSGMGKTSFVVNYYDFNLNLPPGRKQRLAIVPLGSRKADDYIRELLKDEPDKVTIFLDAFDEDAKAVQNHRARLHTLMQLCEPFRRVLVTCRSQFFPSDEEIPRETGIANFAPRTGEAPIYQFRKFYLSPLDDKQVAKYLRRRYPRNAEKRQRAQAMVEKIPNLAMRPMLLTHIPDLLERNVEVDRAVQLYEHMVTMWIERERKQVPNSEVLHEFSEKLAVDLFVNREQRGAEQAHLSALVTLAREWNIPLEHWQLSGRSLLNRDADGNYKFAHRSIMEYLVATQCLKGNEVCKNVGLTDQIRAFLRELILIGGKPLHGANLSQVDLQNTNLQNTNLQNTNLQGADLQGVDLQGVDLQGADLQGANLAGIDLAVVNLQGAHLARARLAGVNLAGVNLTGFDLQNTNLQNTNLEKADLQGANLEKADLQEPT